MSLSSALEWEIPAALICGENLKAAALASYPQRLLGWLNLVKPPGVAHVVDVG